MHFIVEAAAYNNKPCQCYKCFKYGHVAKYCKSENQVCSRCGTLDHKYDNCPNSNQQPICCNCKGEHAATSADCPKFKEYQQKIQKTIDQYSSTTKQIKSAQTCPNWKNVDEFPSFKITEKIDQISIIETLTEKIMLVIEQATERIFEALNRKFEISTNQLGNKLNIEIEDISIEKEDNKQKTYNNSKITTTQYRIVQDRPTEEIQNKNVAPSTIPINGNKREYISPSSLSGKSANTVENDRQNKQGGGVLLAIRNNIKCFEIFNKTIGDNETIAVQIKTPGGHLLVASIYIPPDVKLQPELFEHIYNLNNNCLILGDLNAALHPMGSKRTNTKVFLAEDCHAIKGKKIQQAGNKRGCLSLGAVCNSHTDCCGHDDPESGHCVLCTGILPGLFGVGSRTCGCSKFSVAGSRDTGTLTDICDGKDRTGSRVCRTRVAPPGHMYYRGDDYYYGRGKKT
ncbi:unnamed protein product [Rotaria sp. Silwood1]|nr:unnamed protein product [Rotaria sp. Silwood1]